jgi:hypothetical protein
LGALGKVNESGRLTSNPGLRQQGLLPILEPANAKVPSQIQWLTTIDSPSISLVLSCYLQVLVTLVKSSTIEDYDLLMVADGTASMGPHLKSLNASLPQIISISAITESFSSIGIKGHPRICRSFMMRGGRSLLWRVVTLNRRSGARGCTGHHPRNYRFKWPVSQ